MRPFTVIGVICLAGWLAPACGGIADPSQNITEDFTATLLPFTGRIHEFDVKPKTGEYTATIIAASPNANAVFGIFLGQFVGATCTPILGQSGFAGLNRIALNAQISKGHYCIQVSDPTPTGFAADETYTLRVSHP